MARSRNCFYSEIPWNDGFLPFSADRKPIVKTNKAQRKEGESKRTDRWIRDLIDGVPMRTTKLHLESIRVQHVFHSPIRFDLRFHVERYTRADPIFSFEHRSYFFKQLNIFLLLFALTRSPCISWKLYKVSRSIFFYCVWFRIFN